MIPVQNSPFVAAGAAVNSCRSLWNGAPGRALAIADRAVRSAISRDRSRDRLDLAELHLCRGVSLLMLGRATQGLTELERASWLCGEQRSGLSIEIALWKGDGLARRGLYRQAERRLSDVLERSEQSGLNRLRCLALTTLAKSKLMREDTRDVAPLVREAHAIAVGSDGDDRLMGRVLDATGMLFQELGCTDASIRSYEESRMLFKAGGDSVLESGVLANLGRSYRIGGQHDKGIETLKLAIELAAASGNMLIAGHSINQLAIGLAASGDIDGALEFLEPRMEWLKLSGSTANYATGLLNMGSFLFERGGYDETIRYVEECLTLEVPEHGLRIPLACHAQLAPSYERTGQLEKSVLHYKAYIECKQRLLGPGWNSGAGWARAESETVNPTFSNGRPHPDDAFVAMLTIRYPLLTPAELTVCGLLREGLHSQEVADRIGRSVHTVETHRRSIRRKMGLARDENLLVHLLGFSGD